MSDKKDENKELCKLIDINRDAAEFYDDAKEKAENPEMAATFANLEHLHNNVATNIERQVKMNGGSVDSDGTFFGKSAQFFGEMAASISNDVDETLVKHLEEAEDRCLHSIQDAMEDNDISASTKSLLQGELSVLQKSHDYMKELKDYMKAA